MAFTNNAWYSPGGVGGSGNYGASQDFRTTPLVTEYLDQEIPRGVYHSFLSGQGFGGLDRRSQWGQQQYSNSQTGYQSALRENPALSYLDYLGQQFGGTGMGNIWAGLAPEQRGESPGRWSPQSRFIPWG
jgi:hypothetical protein